jgi:hypothetical protein
MHSGPYNPHRSTVVEPRRAPPTHGLRLPSQVRGARPSGTTAAPLAAADSRQSEAASESRTDGREHPTGPALRLVRGTNVKLTVRCHGVHGPGPPDPAPSSSISSRKADSASRHFK